MKRINFKYFFLVIFISIFSINYSYAAKKNIIFELFVFTKDSSKGMINEKIKNITKISNQIPKPKKYRSNISYKFNEEFINKYIQPNNLTKLEEKNLGEIETFDINNNGITDTIIYFNNPITAYLDLNENNINEIEYVFNGSERFVYYDANEDNNIDYVFIDYNGDGIDEEIIKIEN